MAKCIRYRKGYKYQLFEDYEIQTPILPEKEILDLDYVKLSAEGRLKIKKNYAWDGPSGPARDTKNFMRAALVHDAFYQLLREQKLPPGYRKAIDLLMKQHAREDGMNVFRAWYSHLGVSIFGKPAADPSNAKKPITAPKKCVE